MGDPNERPQTEAGVSGYGRPGKYIKSAVMKGRAGKFLKSAALWQTVSACIIGTLLVGGLLYRYTEEKTAYAVTYDGKFMGYIRNKEDVLEALQDMKERIAEHDSDIKVNDSVRFDAVLLNSDKLTTGDRMAQDVESAYYAKYTSYGISINGKQMALVADKDEADKVVEGVEKFFQKQYADGGAKVLDVNIKDDIKVEEVIADDAKRVDVNTAVKMLTGTRGVEKVYTVKSGDTVWEIAGDNGMKISEIQKLNPGLNINTLKQGQKISLSDSEPYLNVEAVLEASSDTNMPYATNYKSDSSINQGQTKVVSKGEYGIKRVITRITKLNGKEIARSIISTAVVKNPVAQVVARGTKALVGTGRFIWPVSGHLTSGFGSRGGEFHKGIDIAAPHGTRISAADSGTVVYAGWMSGYGNLIIISHGRGYKTYYGHCSAIWVRVGQSVARGQRIGAVGETGRAFGNHVHFEVRLNNRPQSPLKYLR